MNVLLDSGNSKNIGDNAIFLNVLGYLAKHCDANIFAVDKGVGFPLDYCGKKISLTHSYNVLSRMPHWRIQDYKAQAGLWKFSAHFLYWSIMLARKILLLADAFTFRRFRVHVSYNRDIRYWSEILSKMDSYWVVGGGNINDIWVDQAFWKLAFARVFRLQNKPVIFSGQGIGPLRTRISRWIVRQGVKDITLLSLRETVSWALLKSLGAKLHACSVVGDDALASVKNDVPPPGEADSDKKIIALNFRRSYYSLGDGSTVDKYVRLIELLMKKFPEHQFIFVPMAFNWGDSDIETARAIISKIGEGKGRVGVREDAASAQDVRAILRGAALALGVSYHFCLFSLAEGVPTVGLYMNDYYGQKLKGLTQMFGQITEAFDLNKESPERLSARIDELLEKFDRSNTLAAKDGMEREWNAFMLSAMNTIEGKGRCLSAS